MALVRKIAKYFFRFLLGLFILVLLIPVLLYIPYVQDFAVRVASEKVSESTGLKIGIGRFRLGFPLRLRLDDISVLQNPADTMLTAGSAAVTVKLLPLIHGKVDVTRLEIDDAFYQMGNSDSIMWLRAHVNKGEIDGADIDLKNSEINLSKADIDGVRVRLRMLEDTTSAPVDTSASVPWLIRAGAINMSRVSYSMEMKPLIDSLGCTIDDASLREASVDMRHKRIYGRSLVIDSVSAAYLYPAVTSPSATPADTVVSPSSTSSEMWTINADTLRLSGREALYACTGAKPLPGLDMTYIKCSDIDIAVDSFYNRGTSIRVPLRRLSASERCGLSLHAEGVFSMDGNAMKAEGFSIETLRSILRFSASMGLGDLASDPDLPVSLKATGRIDPADVAAAFPSMKAMLAPMRPASLSADIDGTASDLNIYTISMNMPGVARFKAEGAVDHPFDPDRIGGSIALDGSLASMTDKRFSFLPIPYIPALALSGDVRYYPGEAAGDIEVTTRGGRLAADGSWTARSEDYDAHVVLDRFPAGLFLPASVGLGEISGRLAVDGRGYNPMNRRTAVDADIRVDHAVYHGENYRDIALKATLHAGEASGSLVSHNPGADATVNFEAQLHNDTVRYTLDGVLRDINLLTLHMADTVNNGRLNLTSSGFYNLRSQGLDVTADVSELDWHLPGLEIAPSAPLSLRAVSENTGASARLSNGDLRVDFSSPNSVFAFAERLAPAMTIVTGQIDSMRINVPAISAALPRFALLAEMGTDNVAADIIKGSGTTVKHLFTSISNDSLISLQAKATGIKAGNTRVDSVAFNAIQHGDYLVYKAEMNNRPGTFDDFAHVTANGFAGFNRMSIFFKQENIQGEKGFNIGLNAILADSVVTVRLVPLKPMIAYKQWTINKDNFISYDLADNHVDANLNLTGDHSFVKIFTAHNDSTAHSGEQEDVNVSISQIKLQDWLSINPFAPPVKGDLSADLRFRYDKPMITGNGVISLTDFYYGRDRVGNFDLEVDVSNTAGGKTMADVALLVDSVKTITARGVLNDSTLSTPFLLDFDMVRFPLHVANPFIPEGMATLSGLLNGKMKITGDFASPVFNGYINFDTTAVRVNMLGTSFRFSDEKIPVDSNVVSFNEFAIHGCNSNPLILNGDVNARNISDILLDLTMKAKNIQVVNSRRASKGAEVYGKAYLDINASVKGSMSYLAANADISVLENTNVTYVMTSAETTLTRSSTDDMVHFVVFADTTAVESSDSIAKSAMMLAVNADLHLLEGSTFNVDLGGSNKVQILPAGDLDFSMSPLNGIRMTGRVNINSGFARYSVPLIGEKNFSFEDGSYVAFNGDVMNPVLNVHAVDQVRANVTQSGENSRLVTFDVSLAVTNTLENMNVVFDLSTNDDITVQNELASMSPEQRANQAMNLLLYKVYSGSGTKATANIGGNPLFSFLTSQLNSWAANNIKGVDISFGIDQYDRTLDGSTSTTTSYNYRVSKSLFNDRFKIMVGGNYSTDANADENFSQNLINDISFEYMLNKSGSMYIRVFRHTGYESILEGEITQTGVGFVLKRKLNSLRELFGIKRD